MFFFLETLLMAYNLLLNPMNSFIKLEGVSSLKYNNVLSAKLDCEILLSKAINKKKNS